MVWVSKGRHVPDRIRKAMLDRDGHQCVAATRDGRCRETTELEAAHYGRWQPGETTTVDMVRTLCHWHHMRETQAEARAARPYLTETRPPEKHPGLR